MILKFRKLSLIPHLLLAFLLLLAVLHITAVLLHNVYPGNAFVNELSRYVDLDRERNIPTLYSSLILGMCAFCCIALSTKCRHWINRLVYYAYGVFFMYVAFDESLVIHEGAAEPIRNFLGIGDGHPLYHAWVLPALGVLLIGFVFYKFLRDRGDDTKFQKKLLLLVLLMGTGVVLLEIIGTKLYVSPLAYKLGPVLVEELFEIGMVSYILAKLSGRLLASKQ